MLGRDFTATAPNRKWVADITSIPTHRGWLYLVGILDVYSRRAIGYAMDVCRDERLVETALEVALGTRQPRAGLLHDSDRLPRSLGMSSDRAEHEWEGGTP